MPQTTTTIAGKVPGVTVSVTISEPDIIEHAEQAGPPPLTVGATVEAADFVQLGPGGRDQGAEFCRTFSRPGEGIIDWAHPRRKLPKGVAEFHSFKDWTSDAAAVAELTHLLDTMPAELLEGEALLPHLTAFDPDGYAPDSVDYDGFSFLLDWKHEGEPDCLAEGIPVREWRRRHTLAYRTIRQHRNGRRVGYMPIQTGTWTEANSVSGKAVKGDFDPLAWWAGVGDYAGYDAYAISITDKPAGTALYKAAADFLAVPFRLARGSGRRLFLPELGVILQGANPQDTGTYRAAWIRAVIAELREQGCAGVAWWDALGANKRDFRLLDDPSRLAWQDAIYGR